MPQLTQTWRWYGPDDPVSLQDVKQAGATGIVTALHHIPHGEVWPVEEIMKRKNQIESAGLKWSVVESLPVHEAIKTRNEHAEKYLKNYIQSLTNLGTCGIKTICYNFMPVLDWTRTQLDLVMEDGSKALYFDWVDLAIFDIYILERNDAARDYRKEILDQVEARRITKSDEDLKILKQSILMGIPGENDTSLHELRKSLDTYEHIGHEGLRNNLLHFLNTISEVCKIESINMTIHPDDPPYPILGLPRIASNVNDLAYIIEGVNESFNGICFCTGSLAASQENNLLDIFERVKHRVNFLHLRNVKKDEFGNFYESDHLNGDVNMYQIMKAIVTENGNREKPLPFRPDHGHQMLDDLHKTTNPGYSAIGRLRGLAELRGLELGIMGN